MLDTPINDNGSAPTCNNNISEDERHEKNSTMRKIVEYFNSLTKQTNYHEKKVILNGILNYQSIKDIYNIEI